MKDLLIRALEVLLILGILYLAGCQSVRGIAADSGWLLTSLADNIKAVE